MKHKPFISILSLIIVWGLILPLIAVLLAPVGVIGLICIVLTVSGLNKEAYPYFVNWIRFFMPINISKSIETSSIADIVNAIANDKEAFWLTNKAIEYYAEVVKITVDGTAERNEDGSYVLRTLRLYAMKKTWHDLPRVSTWNLRGIRANLEKNGNLVQQIYYRMPGSARFDSVPRVKL